MNRRWLFFLLAILTGVAVGLWYGWVVNPVQYVDTAPDSLRVDYKADVVLMVAEAFQADQDRDAAARRLALLGDDPPEDIIRQAIVFALQAGYAPADLEKLRRLDLAFRQPASGGRAP